MEWERFMPYAGVLVYCLFNMRPTEPVVGADIVAIFVMFGSLRMLFSTPKEPS